MFSIPILRPDETPRARAERYAGSLAASVLSEVVMAGITIDGERVVATTVDRRAGLRVVVQLVRYVGPAWEPVPVPGLTAQQRDIVAACNREIPTNAKKIARALGKSEVSSYLREQLRRLVDSGRLRRYGGGYLAL